MFRSVLLLGHLRGIRLEIHVSWLVIFALLMITMTTGLQQQYPDWPMMLAAGTALFIATAFFASIVAHEMGHSLVAIRRGVPVHAITLFIFGGAAQMSADTQRARDEFWIAIAGPLVSFALSAGFLVLAGMTAGWFEPLTVALTWLGAVNLMVAIFNLIPGFPLDGGRVFRAAVWHFTGDPDKGIQAAVTGGRWVAYGLFAVALWNLLVNGQLLSGLWLMLIGWFLLVMAEGHGRSYALNRHLSGIRARDLGDEAVPRVSAGMSLEEWIQYQVLPSGQRAYMVEDSGDMQGLVSLSDARRIPRERWPGVSVFEVMTPREKLVCVDADEPAESVLRLMSERNLNQVPVRDGERLTGWIDRQKLIRTLENQVELRRSLQQR